MKYDGSVLATYRKRQEKQKAYQKEYAQKNRKKLTEYQKEYNRGKRWLEGKKMNCRNKRDCANCKLRDCEVSA